MDVKDNVPYLKAWPENVSVPAKRVDDDLASTKVSLKSSATGRSATPCSEELAKSLRESGDFSHGSCYKLLKSVRFKASKNKRSIITNDSKSPDSEAEYVVLGAFCHGGMQGITSRSHQNKELSKYLNRYLTRHGAKGPSTSICINHGSSIRMHKDSHNHREYQNNTLCLGDHSGGELWVHDPEADPKSKRYHCAKAKDGTKLPGKLHVTKHRILTFNPKTYHAVRPWKGDRWSITSYVNRAVHKLDSEQLAQLKEYGFHVPSKVSAPSSLLVSPEDKEKTLFDLVSDGIDKELAADLASKPKAKSKGSKENKKKTKSEPPSSTKPAPPTEEEIAEALELVEEYGTDAEDETADDPGKSRPPEGEAIAPDGESAVKVVKHSKGVEALKEEARSRHHLMTHQPKNPYCDVCQRAKMFHRTPQGG